MDIFSVLSMIGGLAMFLYGMETMGDGLAKTAGGKLEHILEKLTSTPIKGVLLGAAVTAVIQSSSATTVMVVGFVNSGIMNCHRQLVSSWVPISVRRSHPGLSVYPASRVAILFYNS